MPKYRHSYRGGPSLLIVLLMTACGDGAADEPARTAEAVQPAVERSGTVELAGTTHEFQIVRCDLTGARYAGTLIHGTGVQPDGRRMSVQVERIEDDGRMSENVFVSFGSLMDGDVWTAAVHRVPDGRGFSDEAMLEPAEGPLLTLTGGELTAAVTFVRETDGTERSGILRATCPAES